MIVPAIAKNQIGKLSRVAVPRLLHVVRAEVARPLEINQPDRPHVEFAARLDADPSPQTPTEIRVAAAWGRVLHRDVIDVDARFCDEGGDSMMAVSLALELERAFNRLIPVAAIPADATVRSLAYSLAIDGWRPTPAAPVLFRQTKHSERPSVFCLPGVGGNVHCFAPVATALADISRSVIGLPLPGTDRLESPLRTLEAIARRFAESIRSLHAGGPLVIAGYSFGGRVGHVLCGQLQAAGIRVERLILIDTPGHDWPKPYRGWDRVRMQLARAFEDGPAATYRRWKQSSQPRDVDSAAAILREMALEQAPPERQALQLAMSEASRDANRAWSPQKVNVPITIVRARTAAWKHCDTRDPAMGWAPYAGAGLAVRWVDGDHANLFKPAQVEGLARAIRDEVADVARQAA